MDILIIWPFSYYYKLRLFYFVILTNVPLGYNLPSATICSFQTLLIISTNIQICLGHLENN